MTAPDHTPEQFTSLLHARGHPYMNRGSARSASQSSASSHGTGFAGPRTGSTASDRQHAEAQHGRERVDHLRLIAPVADAACQGLGQAQAAFRLAQQDEAAVRRDQATIEGGTHLLALDAWQIEGEKAIVGHGGRGAFVVRRGRRLDNEFLPDGNGLRYVRHPKIRPDSRVGGWRASVRVRWLFRRFRSGPQSGSRGRVSSPPLTEPGVPISGTGLSSGIMRLAHGPPGRGGGRAGDPADRGRCTTAILPPVSSPMRRRACSRLDDIEPIEFDSFASACDALRTLGHLGGVLGGATPAGLRPSHVPPHLRPLPSAGITRLPRYCGPLRHPAGPACPSRGAGWRVPATDRVSRVATVPLFHACRRHYPGGAGRCARRSLPGRWQPSPLFGRVGLRIARFEACSTFTARCGPLGR